MQTTQTHNFTRGQHVVDIYGGPDYGFHFVEDAPGCPGMIHIRNERGMTAVPASTYKATND